MWTQKPSDNLVEAVGTPVQSPSAGTFCCIHLPAAEEKVSAEEELAAVEDVAAVKENTAVEELAAEKLAAVEELAAEELAAVEELAAEELGAVEDLDAVEDQRGGVVPSREEASGPAGSSRTAGVVGWPVS